MKTDIEITEIDLTQQPSKMATAAYFKGLTNTSGESLLMFGAKGGNLAIVLLAQNADVTVSLRQCH